MAKTNVASRRVLCDWCGHDYTDETISGGLLYRAKATGPCCEAKIRRSAVAFTEEHFIAATCPAGMPFAEWVRSMGQVAGLDYAAPAERKAK